MPFIELGQWGTEFRTPDAIDSRNIRGGIITSQEIVLAGGTTGIIRSQNYDETSAGWAIFGDGSATFNSVSIRSDLLSTNWDGDNPADLSSSYDVDATEGWYLDSGGSAQFSNNIYVAGELQLFDEASTTNTEYWSLKRGSLDNFAVSFVDVGGTTTRFRIDDVGDIRFSKEDGTLTLLWDEAGDRWEFQSDMSMEGNNILNVDNITDPGGNNRINFVNGGVVALLDSDGTTARLQILSAGNIAFNDSSGTTLARLNDTAGELQVDDGSGSSFKNTLSGRLIAYGQTGSATQITNVSGTVTELTATKQTVACEYASQNVVIEVTAHVVWTNMSNNTTYIINVGIDGSNYGTNAALKFRPTSTGSGGDNEDIDGSTGGAKAEGVFAGAGALVYNSGGSTHESQQNHTHASGSLAVNGSHTHSAVPTYMPMTVNGIASATAGGLGNVNVSIFASGDGSADIDGWWLTWKVYAA